MSRSRRDLATKRRTCDAVVVATDRRIESPVAFAYCQREPGHDGEHDPKDATGCVVAWLPLDVGYP